MSELLPCPFCKGKAYTIKPARYGKSWGVLCECGAFLGYYNTEAEAIAAWNSRAERTCKLHDCEGSFSAVNKPVWRCDCGAFMTQYTDATTYHKPRFCPNCGALFKEYDELRGDAE